MRIPRGTQSLGNEVARYPQNRTPNLPSIAPAAARFGETLQNSALQIRDDENRAAAYAENEAAQDMKERARQADREIAEAVRARAVANKGQATDRLAYGRETIDALEVQFGEDIQSGVIPKETALEKFREGAAKFIDKLDGVPEEHVAGVKADLQNRVLRNETRVGRHVTKRDRSDTLASLDSTLEHAQRLAVTDPTAAAAMAKTALTELGPHSGLMPDQIAKRGQQWVEKTAYTNAYTSVMVAKDNNGALKKAEQAILTNQNLDPQKRAELLTNIAAFSSANIQRAEAAAARAQRQSDAHLKRAEAEFNVVQGLADKGGMIDPNYIASVASKVAGTPYAAGIKALTEQAVVTGGLARQPLDVQRDELRKVDADIAKNGRSPALDSRRTQIEKVLRASETDAQRDGIAAYAERAGGDPGKIDTSSPQTIAASIKGRVAYAQEAGRWAKAPVSPLYDAEANQLREGLSRLPPREFSAAVAMLSSSMPAEQAQALARQLDPKDKGLALAFASGATGTSNGRYTSELIRAGVQALKDGTSTKGEKTPGVRAATWKANVAAQVNGLFPNQSLTDNVVEAAHFIAHGMASEKGGDLSSRDLELAVGLAVGGKVAEINGRKVALPAGIDEDAVERRLRSITPAEIQQQAGATVRAGGAEVSVADFAKKLPGAELMFASRGKYMVMVQGRPVLGTNNRPVLIDVK
jgi:hypothetical protein